MGETFRIAQFSDIHCGDKRFDEKLLHSVIAEVNRARPDLVLVPGDLTADGYRDQFEEARSFLDLVNEENCLVIAGNHDCRQVGYLHYEDIFGRRSYCTELPFGVGEGRRKQETVKILALDSNKPDLNDGELGRQKTRRIVDEFRDHPGFRILMVHHHLVSIPGTGRERNIVLDAGDVLEACKNAGVNLVFAGHKHVPYVWPVAGMLIITSGTACTYRTRGYSQPSYNMVEVTPDEVVVRMCQPSGGTLSEKRYLRRIFEHDGDEASGWEEGPGDSALGQGPPADPEGVIPGDED